MPSERMQTLTNRVLSLNVSYRFVGRGATMKVNPFGQATQVEPPGVKVEVWDKAVQDPQTDGPWLTGPCCESEEDALALVLDLVDQTPRPLSKSQRIAAGRGAPLGPITAPSAGDLRQTLADRDAEIRRLRAQLEAASARPSAPAAVTRGGE